MDRLLLEGLTDATGFLLGALAGYAAARLLGSDPLAAGYGGGSIVGILLCGLGGGAGLHLARAWRARRSKGR